MNTIVRIPTPLRKLTEGKDKVSVDGQTVGEALQSLERAHPGFEAKLYDAEGGLRRFVNVFVGDEDVRFLQGLSTPLSEGAELSIVPAIAGGC